MQLEDIDEWPKPEVFHQVTDNRSKHEKRAILNALSGKVLDKYIRKADKVQTLLEKIQSATEIDRSKKSAANNQEQYMCRFPGCKKSYRYDGARRCEHEKSDGIVQKKQPEVSIK